MGHSHSHGALDHSHGPVASSTQGKRRLRIALALTSLLMLLEAAGGIASGSLALLADAGHMLADVAGLVLALVAVHFAERPPTPDHTYGYHRVEILAAVVNSVVLIGLSLLILYEGFARLQQPPPVATGLMLVIAAAGLAVNLVSMRVLHGGAATSLNLRGAYLEVFSDALASVGVLVAAIVMRTTGWAYADPLVSIVIGLAILPRTWSLLKEAIGVLLEGVPGDVNLGALRERISRVPGVAGVHDLHVWTLTSGMHAMSVHAVILGDAAHQGVLDDVQRCVTREFRIAHVTVQVEAKGCEGGTHL
jgi:cobalt-zinc-cadmium efflux system protein